VTFDIAPSAQENDSVGCLAYGMTLDGDNIVKTGNLPINSATPIIKPTRDIMEVKWIDAANIDVVQATTNYTMLELDLKTNEREALWSGVRVKKQLHYDDFTLLESSTAVDSDILNMNIYKDSNFSKKLDAGDLLITTGRDKFIEGVAEIYFSEYPQDMRQVIKSAEYEAVQQSINPDWNQKYFICLDVNPTAIVSNFLGITIENTTDFFVVAPDDVQFITSPPAPLSRFSKILDYPDKVTVEMYDIAPNSVIQGDQNTGFIWCRMKADKSQASLKGIIIERIPIGGVQYAGGGSNIDVQYIKIYRDGNSNGILDAEDTLITTGEDQLPSDAVGNQKLIYLVDPNDRTKLKSQLIGALNYASFIITYDVSTTARRDNSLAMRITNKASIILDLSGEKQDEVLAFNTFETRAANIGPIKVITFPNTSIIPTSLVQDRTYPMMALDIATHVHEAGWLGLHVEQISTYDPFSKETSFNLTDDGALAEIGIFKEYVPEGQIVGDGVLGENDIFISSVVWGSSDFKGGSATIYFSTQTIGVAPRRYYIVAKIGRLNAQGVSTEGRTAGIKISGFNYFTINPWTVEAATRTYTEPITTYTFPFISQPGLVMHYSKMSAPVVYVDEWIASQNEVKAAWLPGESPDPVKYPVLYNEYGVATMPITTDIQKPDFTDGYQQVELSTYVAAPMAQPFDHGATYYVVVRSINNITPERPNGIPSLPGSAKFRVDLTPPTVPGKPAPSTYLSGVAATQYTVNWGFSVDPESGVLAYEVQERADSNPVWNWIDVNGDGVKASPKDSHTFSDDLIQGGITKLTVLGKTAGHFYTYRVRAKNKAGSWSAWSAPSEAAVTGLPAEVISGVSNYPNPFDTRLGGEQGKTHITYILNQDADVTITLYDLLGYKVMEMVFGKGQEGGKQGPNDVTWEGKNELGDFVARGGYIALIKAVGATGTKTEYRKIGVIH